MSWNYAGEGGTEHYDASSTEPAAESWQDDQQQQQQQQQDEDEDGEWQNTTQGDSWQEMDDWANRQDDGIGNDWTAANDQSTAAETSDNYDNTWTTTDYNDDNNYNNDY